MGAISSPSPSCWGLKWGGRPYSTETLPGKVMWKKLSAITAASLAPTCGWVVEGGEQLRQEQSTAPLWQCLLSTVLAGPALLMVYIRASCLPQSPCKPVLQGPGAHIMGHSRAQLPGVTPWSGAAHWPHRGDPPALQMNINRHFCPKQPLQFTACPSPSHLHT